MLGEDTAVQETEGAMAMATAASRAWTMASDLTDSVDAMRRGATMEKKTRTVWKKKLLKQSTIP